MKLLVSIAAVALCLPCMGENGSSEKKPVIITKPPSHEDLAKTQKKQKIEQHGKDRAPVKPLVNIKKNDLLAESTLLAFGGNWTLVPRTAVIYTPKIHKSKIVTQPSGTLMTWSNFLRKNGGWLQTYEVTKAQARGHDKIDQKAIKAYKTVGRIVVATYRRAPITVVPAALLPPPTKDDKADKDKAKSKDKKPLIK